MNGRIETRWPAWGWALCGLLAFAAALPSTVVAEQAVLRSGAEPRASTRVLLLAPAEAELTARIRGQTQDLGVLLEVAEPPSNPSAESAAQEGRQRAAVIVVWSQPAGAAGLEVHVLDVQTGELRTRSVSTPANEALASSTTAEMAALVVRSELSALLAEQGARRAAEAEAAARPVEGPTTPRTAETPKAAPGPPPPPAPARWAAWAIGLSYRPSRPVSGSVAHGLGLSLRRDLRSFAVGLVGIATLPLSLSQAGTRIRLFRFQVRLEAHKHWQALASLRLSLGVAGSFSVDQRETEEVGAATQPTADAATLSGSFGLLGECQWLFSRAVGAFVAVGADAVPWRTQFVIKNGSEAERVANLAWLDPWAMVGLFTRFGS